MLIATLPPPTYISTALLIRGAHYPVLLRHTVCLADTTATPIASHSIIPASLLALLFGTRTLLHFPTHTRLRHYSLHPLVTLPPPSLHRANHPPRHLPLLEASYTTVSFAVRPLRSQSRKPTPLHPPPIDVPGPPALHSHCIAPLHLHQHHRQRCNCLAAPRFFAARYLRLALTYLQTASFLPDILRL